MVWLSDERREEYLNQIRDMAVRRESQTPAPVVFEGNAPADMADNHLLHQLLSDAATCRTEKRSAGAASAPRAWLGDALAINDLTAAAFRRQNGSNLLIVGQQDQMALGVLTSAVISLAAQSAAARFTLIDARQSERRRPASGRSCRTPCRRRCA